MNRNSIGRDFPEAANGYGTLKGFAGNAGASSGAAASPAGRRSDAKVYARLELALDAVGVQSGMTVSFHHHFREGDRVVSLVMEALARAIDGGEITVDVAFLGVPCCGERGNANGSSGASACGSLGYAMVDARNAKKVVLLGAMAACDDTCLVARGGIEALGAARRQAATVLDAGGPASADGAALYAAMVDRFLVSRLSPGGAADLCAAALFLTDLETACLSSA